MKKITIMGTGYVGLVTGVSLARLGHKVICVGRNKDKIEAINNGKSPFFEPGLDNLLVKLTKKGLLVATNNLKESVISSDFTIIAVGTPTVNNKIDLSEIREASKQIGEALGYIRKYHVVIIKSTVIPGTSENVVKPILEEYSSKNVGKDFGLCMNPEFLREGNALDDALDPDRIVIGQYDDKSGKEFAKIYKKYRCPIIFTNLKTAEMTKYASNALFATLISFSNEIARVSEKATGVDVLDVWKGVHLDRRLSPVIGKTRIRPGMLSYILSGCGYGGSCFPKDTKALANFADELQEEAKLVKNVIEINSTQPHRLIILLKDALSEIKNKRIAVLGLSFKPNTDDLRESAAFPVIEELLSGGAKVICHDPQVYKKNIPEKLKSLPIVLVKTAKEAIMDSDAVLIITSWDEYIKLTPQSFKQYMKTPIIIDGRRIYNKEKFKKAGIIYKGIGLGN